MQKHQEALDALALDHAGKLKEAVDRAVAAEATRIELAGKVEKLEADLVDLTKEISTLKDDREKALYDLAEMQTTISDKTKLLSKVNKFIDDLKLKLDSQEKMLSESKAREQLLAKDLADKQLLLRTAASSHNKLVESTKLWTSHLVDVAEKLTAQLTAMGMPNFRFSHEARVAESARLSEFFERVLAALKLLQSTRAAYLAEESRQLCRDALIKVLTKVAHWNPSVDFAQALDSLPEDVDRQALEEHIEPIISCVNGVVRLEGQRWD